MSELKKEEIKKAIESMPDINDSVEEDRLRFELEKDKEEAMLLAVERRDLITMRRKWSDWTLVVIVMVTFFDMALILLIGTESLKFDNDFQIPFFIGESLLKVLGLAFLIVNFLFNHKSLGNR